MKRFILFIMMSVCALTGAWADVPTGATAIGDNGSYWMISGGVLTVHVEAAGDLSNAAQNSWSWGAAVPWKDEDPAPTTLKLDLASTVSVAEMGTNDDFYALWQNPKPATFNLIDLSGLTAAQAEAFTAESNVKLTSSSTKGILVPSSNATDPSEFYTVSGVNNYGISGSSVYAYFTSDTQSDLASVVALADETVTSVNISGTGTGSNVIGAINSLTTATDLSVTGKLHEGVSITIDNDNITGIDLSDIEDANGTAVAVDLSGCANLQSVNLSGANVSNVNLSGLENLQSVTLTDANVSETINLTNSLHDGLKIVGAGDNADNISPTLTDEQKEAYMEEGTSTKAPEGAIADSKGCCWIVYDADNKVATVHATVAGHFKTLYESNSGTFAEGTRFAFDNASLLKKDDLLAIMQGNKFYIDLFNITNGEDTPMKIDDYTTTDDDENSNNIDKIVEAAVADMVTNGYQAKGIILPLNTGSGTTKMEKKGAYEDATFTEYAAYYRETQKTAAIFVHDPQVRYNQPEAVANYAQPRFNIAIAHLQSHAEVTEGAETYMVSTNNQHQIDLSEQIPNTATQIMIVNNELVYRETIADIYVTSVNAGDFAKAVTNTGIKSTPCVTVKISGPVNASDLTAINSFTDGPVSFNLRESTGATADMLDDLTNSKIEYVILPGGFTREEMVASTFSGLSNLKAAISLSADGTTLVGYIKQAGSLGTARYYATGDGSEVKNASNEVIGYNATTTSTLTSVTLSGSLNGFDLAANTSKVKTDGHYDAATTYEGADVLKGLNGEQVNITTLDLTYATFDTPTDLNISGYGLTNLTTLRLPIASTMTTLPDECLYNIATLQQVCIPSNYKVIGTNALGLCGALTIITDNDDHTLFIGKEGQSFLTETEAFTESNNTYTFSKNVTDIKTGAFQTKSTTLTDVYVMATTTPTCEKDAFSEGMYQGWGGFEGGDFPYCREKYINSGIYFTVLHYPAQGTTADDDYETMEKQYTDVTKIYTKKEQTGAKDANGKVLLWPTFSELLRVYAQASASQTWHAFATAYNGQQEVNKTEADASAEGYTIDSSITGSTYTFEDYVGWHQFVLTMATAYEKTETVDEETKKIVRNYTDAGWFTFCIPFDITTEEAIEMLGVPQSDDSYTNYLDGTEMTSAYQAPEIYQLKAVERIKDDENGNKVKFILTADLFKAAGSDYLDFTNLEANGNGQTRKTTSNVCLKGGHPYIIRAYKRTGETIKGRNLGQYIMDNYGNKFKESASCLKSGLYEQLGEGSLTTLQFARPYEEHKVQAVKTDVENPSYLTYVDDNNDSQHYNYTLVGQFWTQKLPKYCIYMSGNNKWYRNVTDTYDWSAYKCVIIPTPVKKYGKGHDGGFYRNNEEGGSNYPKVEEGTTDLLKSDFYLNFLNGRNDDDFDTAPYDAKTTYMFAFDDEGIVEYNESGMETTVIDNIDSEEPIRMRTRYSDRVYNLSGQYVGNSLEGLSKGLYIMNGKKYVVK